MNLRDTPCRSRAWEFSLCLLTTDTAILQASSRLQACEAGSDDDALHHRRVRTKEWRGYVGMNLTEIASQSVRARSQGQLRTFVRWRPPSGARRPPHRSRHPEAPPTVCEPGVPRAHGATCPTPPTQISTSSPRCSCAPSREPCSATRCLGSNRGTRTRGAPSWRTSGATGAKDPLTRRALSSTKVMTNWAMRNVVQDWLDKHPGVTPDGWDSRELLEPSKDDGTRTFDDEGDAGVLRTWRAMCPELQESWPED